MTQLSAGAPALRHSVVAASATLPAPTHGDASGLFCAQASSTGLSAAEAAAGMVSAAASAQARAVIVRDTPVETPAGAVTCAALVGWSHAPARGARRVSGPRRRGDRHAR